MIQYSNSFHKVRRDIRLSMSVTEESGGRLNAFSKEPKIEVITQEARTNSNFRLLIFTGVLFIMGVISYVVFFS